jgi:hypothetical protein
LELVNNQQQESCRSRRPVSPNAAR